MEYPYDKPGHLEVPLESQATREPRWPLVTLPWLGLAGWFLVCDLAIAPCAEEWGPDEWGAIFVYGSAGPLFAQFAILPVWLVLGSPAYWLRLVLVWSAALVAYGAWWLGLAAAELFDGISDSLARDALAFLLVLPAVSLAVEAPLWLLRVVLGWRIAQRSGALVPHRKLAIRDMLLTTTLVAVALAAARIAVRLMGYTDEVEFWLALGIAVISLGGASAVLLPPIIWFALRVENATLAAAGAMLHATGLGTIFVVVVALSGWTPGGSRMWGHLGVTVTAVTFAACVSAPFWLARLQGYRLVRADSAAS